MPRAHLLGTDAKERRTKISRLLDVPPSWSDIMILYAQIPRPPKDPPPGPRKPNGEPPEDPSERPDERPPSPIPEPPYEIPPEPPPPV